MARTQVSIAAVEGSEYQLLRLHLESCGAEVFLPPASIPRDLLRALSEPNDVGYLIVSGHGDERGVLLPELAEELAGRQPFREVLTPELVREHCSLGGQVVISLACASGSQEIARAFLDAGAAAYIAPVGYPHAEDAVFFAAVLFHGLLAQGLDLDLAFQRAKKAGRDTELFCLYRAPTKIERMQLQLAS